MKGSFDNILKGVNEVSDIQGEWRVTDIVGLELLIKILVDWHSMLQ